MKKTLSLAAMLALACGFAAEAQTISDADIRQMRDSFQRDNATVAAQNALTSTANKVFFSFQSVSLPSSLLRIQFLFLLPSGSVQRAVP